MSPTLQASQNMPYGLPGVNAQLPLLWETGVLNLEFGIWKLIPERTHVLSFLVPNLLFPI